MTRIEGLWNSIPNNMLCTLNVVWMVIKNTCVCMHVLDFSTAVHLSWAVFSPTDLWPFSWYNSSIKGYDWKSEQAFWRRFYHARQNYERFLSLLRPSKLGSIFGHVLFRLVPQNTISLETACHQMLLRIIWRLRHHIVEGFPIECRKPYSYRILSAFTVGRFSVLS